MVTVIECPDCEQDIDITTGTGKCPSCGEGIAVIDSVHRPSSYTPDGWHNVDTIEGLNGIDSADHDSYLVAWAVVCTAEPFNVFAIASPVMTPPVFPQREGIM